MPIKWTQSGEPWIDPARLRSRITFLRPSQATDASGASSSWAAASPPDVTNAELMPVRGTDVIKAGQDVTQVYLTATIRYAPPGRTASMRFQDSKGVIYIIQAVEDLVPGRPVYQVLTCLLLGANA